jgi:hypothetical protein
VSPVNRALDDDLRRDRQRDHVRPEQERVDYGRLTWALPGLER